jgi:undecaprenyl phosphate-alpha-L-ara4N flippase subunit ArnF
MSLQRGLSFALGSVVLVSSAQLGMRWSMARLPVPSQWLHAFSAGSLSYPDLAIVIGAILAYVLSMGCWLMALRDLPLGRAYSLLSISYALVYLLAASIAAFHEDFSAFKTLGVTLVILGVLTINSRRTPRIEP